MAKLSITIGKTETNKGSGLGIYTQMEDADELQAAMKVFIESGMDIEVLRGFDVATLLGVSIAMGINTVVHDALQALDIGPSDEVLGDPSRGVDARDRAITMGIIKDPALQKDLEEISKMLGDITPDKETA